MKQIAIFLTIFFYVSVFSQGVIPSKGTDFWVGFPYSPRVSSSTTPKRCDLFITSSQNATGTVNIPLQGISQSFTVVANQTTTISLSVAQAENVLSEIAESRGVHVLSDVPVSVFSISFQDYSADGTVVYPLQSLGTKYRIASYQGLGTNLNINSDFLIVATEDNTKVRITPTAATLLGKPSGVPFIVTLNAGQSYQVIGEDASSDFTGTLIEGTDSSGDCRPFAVFSGVACVNVPLGCTACDILYDQALPYTNWGKNFYIAPFATTTGYTLRVIADQNGTTFSMNGGTSVSLNAGQFQEYNHVSTANCISANKPICVAQYMEGLSCAGAGDPSLVYINPIEQSMDNVTFSTVTSSIITNHTVNVTMRSAFLSQLKLDNVPVPTTAFTPYPNCAGYSYVQLNLTQGSHTLGADSGFLGIAYGIGSYETYAYSVGSFSKSIPIKVDSVLCTNDTLHLGTTAAVYNGWWSRNTFPTDTIGLGNSLVLLPPIIPDLYILHSTLLISGCDKVNYYNVQVPDPPTLVAIAHQSSICKYESTQLFANVLPFSTSYNFSWTPTTGLSNPNIWNPIASPMVNTQFKVVVSKPGGCGVSVSDSTLVTVTAGVVGTMKINTTASKICVGDSAKMWLNVQKVVFEELIDTLITASKWSSLQGGIASNACGSFNGNALYFNNAGTRSAATIGVDVIGGGTLSFYLKVGSGTAPCEDADPGEDVVVEYSTNGGGSWTVISTLNEAFYPNFTLLNINIPLAAQTANTQFRWRQLTHSGAGQDNWAIDQILIKKNITTGYTVAWSPATGLSAINKDTVWAKPLVTTVYHVLTTDTVFGCTFEDTIKIIVGQNFTLNTTNDTASCTTGGLQIHSIPSIPGSYTYQWSPSTGLSNTTSQTIQADPPFTTVYSVIVTSFAGCIRYDTVKVKYGGKATFNVTPDVANLCVGQSTVASSLLLKGCGTSASSCNGAAASVQLGTLSNSDGTYYLPYSAYNKSAKQQYLILASELNALGISGPSTLSSLAFNIAFVYGTSSYQNFSMKMGCTNLTDLGNRYSFIQGLSQVYIPRTVNINTGLNNYVFDNKYDWDGVSNLVIEVCFENSTTFSSSYVYYNTTSFYSCLYQYNYLQGVCNDTSAYHYYYRPTMNFTACATVPSFLLNSWTPSAGVSNTHIANPTLTPSSSTTYTLLTTDTSTGCKYSDTLRVNVGVHFSIQASNDTQLCVAGGVPISVTHGGGVGATIAWSPSSSLNDSTIANPVATPNFTTSYMVSIKSVAGCIERDTVKVKYAGKATFNVTPHVANLCTGQSTVTNSLLAKGCGTNASSCNGAVASVQLGTISSSYGSAYLPYAGYNKSAKQQYLILASELNALGISGPSTLSSLAFNIASVYGTSSYQNFSLKMGCTNLTDFGSAYRFIQGLSQVYIPRTVNIATGVNNYVFDNKYDWDGVSNLVVEVCFENSTTSSASSVYYNNASFNCCLYKASYSQGVCNDTAAYNYYYRPTMNFTACATAPINLLYNWTPSAGVSNAHIANPVLNPSSSSTTYTLLATDTSTGCKYSDTIRVNVGTHFSIQASNDTQLCVASGVPISVIHGAGVGASIAWSPSNSLNDSTIANPVATPNFTTSYMVSIKSVAGCIERDTVKVKYAGKATFNVTPHVANLCTGQSTVTSSLLLKGCGTSVSSCNGAASSVQLGTLSSSSGSSYFPYSGDYKSAKQQYLILASELNALGISGPSTLSSLSFNIAYIWGTSSYQNFSLKMGCTNLTDLGNRYSFIQGLSQVYIPRTVNIATGINNYVFDNKYDWDGVSNLVVEVCFENSTTSNASSVYFNYTSFYSSLYLYDYLQGVCNDTFANIYSYRPTMNFTSCATASPPLLYNWTPSAGVSNAHIANPVLNPSSSSTTYTLLATDTSTGCKYSDTIRVNVGTHFSIQASNDTQLCVAGGVPISVTHGGGVGASIAWSPSSSLNDSTIANPVATPNFTTNYVVSVKSATGCIERDTVKVKYAGKASFNVTPDVVNLCSGQSTVTSSLLLKGCGTSVSSCNGAASSVQLGTLSSSYASYYLPYSGDYKSAKQQYLILASELNALGISGPSTLSSLAFNIASVYGTSSYQNFSLKMGCTNLTDLGNRYSFIQGLSQVYIPRTVNINTGLNNYVFDNKYDWDGISNLVIEVCFENSTNSSSSYLYYNNTSFYSCLYQANYSQGVCNDTVANNTSSRPTMNFTACATAPINLLYNWTPSAGVSNTHIANPALTPSTSTTYTLLATDTSTGCKYSDTLRVNMGTHFSIQASNDTQLCVAGGVPISVIHAAGAGATIGWSPSSSLNDSTSANPIATPNFTTSYMVSVKSVAGCIERDTVKVKYAGKATLNVTPDVANLCSGQSTVTSSLLLKGCGTNASSCNGAVASVQLGTLSSSDGSYYLPYSGYYKSTKQQYLILASELNALGISGPSTLSSLAFNISSVYGTSSYQNFSLKMGCTNLTDLGNRYSFIQGLSQVYIPRTVNINTGLNNYVFDNKYDWDGISNLEIEVCFENSTNSSSSYVYYNTTTFYSCLYLANYSQGVCNDTASNYYYYYRPTMNFTACPTASPSLVYNWTPSAGVSNTHIANPTLTPSTSTTYTLLATDTSTGCKYSDSLRVNMGGNFSIQASNDTIVCSSIGLPLRVTLSIPNNVSYAWQPASKLNNANIANPIITVNGTQQFIVTVSDSAGCTIRKDTVNVTVKTPATIAVSNDTSICVGNSVSLFAHGGMSVLWSPPTFLSSTNTANTTSTPSNSIKYQATITDSIGCIINDSVIISTTPLPVVKLQNDTSICAGKTVVFNAGAGFATYLWQNNSSAQTFTASQAGTYWVKVTNSCGIARDTAVILNLFPLPIVNLGADSTLCLGDSVLLNAGNTGQNFVWSTTAATQTILVKNSGNYQVTVTDQNGCKNSDTVSIHFLGANGINLGNDTTLCHATDSLVLSALVAGAQYHWSDNSTLSTLTVKNAGTYFVEITTPSHCYIFDTIVVNYKTALLVNLGNDTILCAGLPLILDAKNVGQTILWSNSSVTQTIAPTQSGVYWVDVSYSGQCKTRDSIQVTFSPAPVVNLGNDTTLCHATDSLVLSALVTAAQYHWSDNSTLSTLTVKNAGTYFVEVTTSSHCHVFDTIVINYKTTLLVNLGNDTILCAGSPLILDAKNVGQTILWSNSSVTQTIAPTQSGVYWVDVSYSGQCKTRDSIQVTFSSAPVVNLGNDTTLCHATDSLVLSAFVSGAQYHWSDNSTLSTLTVKNAGTYFVEVTTSSHCHVFDTIVINYKTALLVNLGNDTILCAGSPLILDAKNGGQTILWSNSSVTQTIAPTQSGVYWVDVSYSGQCKTRDSIQVTFSPAPVVNLGNDTSFCEGDSLKLSSNIIGLYDWSTNQHTASIFVKNAGGYSLSVTDTLGCKGTDSIHITKNLKPQVQLGNDTLICQGQSVILNAGNLGSNYQWSTLTNTRLDTILATGIVWVKVTNAARCMNSDTINITVQPLPILAIVGKDSICKEDSTLLTVSSSTASSFVWSPSTFVSSPNAATTWISPIVSTTYSVIGKDSVGCTATKQINLQVGNMPTLFLGKDTGFCEGDSILLTASIISPNYHYLWQNNSTNTSIYATQKGLYWLDVSNWCGSIRDSISVDSIYPKPKIDLGKNGERCDEPTIILDAANPGSTYLWSSNEQTQTIHPKVSGNYSVTVTSNQSCSASGTVSLQIISKPIISLGDDQEVCNGTLILLNAGASHANYLWQNGSTDSLMQVDSSGVYWVVASNVCGSVADSINILFKDCGCKFYIPNVFSPNNDLHNDEFKVYYKCSILFFELNIFNRWGEKLYSSEDSEKGWDGTYKEEIQPNGVYIYNLTLGALENTTKKTYTLKGSITLLR